MKNQGTKIAATPTIEKIHQHSSVRDYQTKPVPKERIETIVAAGQRASTSSNLQMYSVVATTDEKKRKHLRELSGGQEHIEQAPVFLTWCADLSRLRRVCELQGYTQEAGYIENFLLAVVDVSLAMQNAALAAESLGLGICYIGGIRNNPLDVINLLALPPLVFPVSGMTLGWPKSPPTIRPRLPLEAVLHWDHYHPEDEKHRKAYDKAMIETGIYADRQVKGTKLDETVYGWQEHSGRRASRPLRVHLLEALRKAGFLTSEK